MDMLTFWNKKTLYLFAIILSTLFVVSGWQFYLGVQNMLMIGLPALVFNFLLILVMMFFNSFALQKYFAEKYRSPFAIRRYLFVAAIGTIVSVAIAVVIYTTVLPLVSLNTGNGGRIEIKLPVILVFSILFYGLLAWKIKTQHPESELPQPKTEITDTRVHIKTGNRHTLISVSDIVWLARKNDATLIKLQNGEEYITYDTLNKFYNTYLTESEFFRADRKFIISKRAVSGYTRLPNRNLSLNITPAPLTTVMVNKNNVKEFIGWMDS